jgi:hypothetical protein
MSLPFPVGSAHGVGEPGVGVIDLVLVGSGRGEGEFDPAHADAREGAELQELEADSAAARRSKLVVGRADARPGSQKHIRVSKLFVAAIDAIGERRCPRLDRGARRPSLLTGYGRGWGFGKVLAYDVAFERDVGASMRGGDLNTGALFSYVSCEERVAKDHLLRTIREIVNAALAALSPEFEKLYARLGRPSIAPEKLLRALLLQAFYSVRSERQLMEQLD